MTDLSNEDLGTACSRPTGNSVLKWLSSGFGSLMNGFYAHAFGRHPAQGRDKAVEQDLRYLDEDTYEDLEGALNNDLNNELLERYELGASRRGTRY